MARRPEETPLKWISESENHELNVSQQAIKTLNEKVQSLHSRLDDVEHTVDDVGGDADNLKEQVEAVASKLSRVEDRLEQLTSEVYGKIQDLEEELRASESNLLQFTQHNENAITQLNEFLESFASKHNAVNQRSRDNEERLDELVSQSNHVRQIARGNKKRLDRLEEDGEGDETVSKGDIETVADWLKDGWLTHPFKRHIVTAVQHFAGGKYTQAQESLMIASQRVSEIALEEKEG